MVLVDSRDLYSNTLVFVLYKHSVTCIPFSDMFMCTICSAFLASGLTVPVAVSSCAAALRKVCEDSPNLSHESTSIAGLLRIGEVFYFILCGFVLNLTKF